MPLFPQQEGAVSLEGAPGRMAWTREMGTRKLVLGFIGVLVILGAAWWIRDYQLLRTQWPKLEPVSDGLTVAGLLNSRESYDRNIFRVVTAGGESRVELTSWGWESIFTDSNGKLCSENAGNTIRHVISIDSEIGYAMLEPYLRAVVNEQRNIPNSFASLSPSIPISISKPADRAGFPKETTLGTLLEFYQKESAGPEHQNTSDSEGGSSNGHDVDHGLTIPGGNLIHACPIVLVGRNFTGGSVQEFPAGIMGGKTYSVHLELTPEGRSRFYQWSRFHSHESLVFVLNNQVVAQGRIAQTMDVNDWEITNLKDPEAANILVNYVKQQAGKSN